MKSHKWTLALAAAGVIAAPSAFAEEATETVMTAVSDTTISGYVSTSMIWRPGTHAGVNGTDRAAYAIGGKEDGFNLDLVSIKVAKDLDDSEWAAGYSAQLLYGPDAAAYTAVSTSAGSVPGGVATTTDIAIKNANVTVRAPIGNGLDITMGVFDTIVGYEVVDYDSNPNYTRAYAFNFEPFNHTGVLLSYQVNDMIGLTAGIANTGTSGVNTRATTVLGGETQKAYMGAISVTLPDSMGFLAGANAYFGIVDGSGSAASGANQTWYYAGLAVPTPLENLAVGVAFDHVNSSLIGAAGAGDASFLSGYLSYAFTEDLALHLRGEYVNASAGTVLINGLGLDRDKVFALTSTLDYKVWENVITRAEVRWDTSIGNGNQPFGTVAAPGSQKNILTFGVNMVYSF